MARLSPYPFDPTRILVTGHPGLDRIMMDTPESVASVDEYATAAGLSPQQVLEIFAPFLEAGALAIEVVAQTMFVHTAPQGRPIPPDLPDVAPNMWERLRDHGGPDEAWMWWRVLRAAERAGWEIEVNPARIRFELAGQEVPPAGLRIREQIAPLIPHPDPDRFAAPGGDLDRVEALASNIAAVTVPLGALERYVTLVRRWMLDRIATGRTPRAKILILEDPHFTPVLVTADDRAAEPVTVARGTLGDWTDHPS